MQLRVTSSPDRDCRCHGPFSLSPQRYATNRIFPFQSCTQMAVIIGKNAQSTAGRRRTRNIVGQCRSLPLRRNSFSFARGCRSRLFAFAVGRFFLTFIGRLPVLRRFILWLDWFLRLAIVCPPTRRDEPILGATAFPSQKVLWSFSNFQFRIYLSAMEKKM